MAIVASVGEFYRKWRASKDLKIGNVQHNGLKPAYWANVTFL
jgi:hypothetical protein